MNPTPFFPNGEATRLVQFLRRAHIENLRAHTTSMQVYCELLLQFGAYARPAYAAHGLIDQLQYLYENSPVVP